VATILDPPLVALDCRSTLPNLDSVQLVGGAATLIAIAHAGSVRTVETTATSATAASSFSLTDFPEVLLINDLSTHVTAAPGGETANNDACRFDAEVVCLLNDFEVAVTYEDASGLTKGATVVEFSGPPGGFGRALVYLHYIDNVPNVEDAAFDIDPRGPDDVTGLEPHIDPVRVDIERGLLDAVRADAFANENVLVTIVITNKKTGKTTTIVKGVGTRHVARDLEN
jgi:hypothetical protein